MISRHVGVSIQLTVAELAEEFCDLGADDQARFFTVLAAIANRDKWPGGWAIQAGYIVARPELNEDARTVLHHLANGG